MKRQGALSRIGDKTKFYKKNSKVVLSKAKIVPQENQQNTKNDETQTQMNVERVNTIRLNIF